jgi:DDE superfamily endonuclease
MVLKPYVEGAPPGIQPVLFLDSYQCHMMASVVNDIQQDLGVQIETIPGGCTGLCQPIDIGIGKPLKSRAQHLWEEWIINEGINNAVVRPPSRLLLSHWITDSMQRIRDSTPSIVCNSWRHGAYSYFPNEGQGETVVQVQHQEDVGIEQEADEE